MLRYYAEHSFGAAYMRIAPLYAEICASVHVSLYVPLPARAYIRFKPNAAYIFAFVTGRTVFPVAAPKSRYWRRILKLNSLLFVSPVQCVSLSS